MAEKWIAAAHLKKGPTGDPADGRATRSTHEEVHRRAVAAARGTVFEMRARGDIGDDAFHRLEEELDWIEMGSTGGGGSS